MEEAALIERLLQFGLGRQEAGLYLCLLRHGGLTGYEVAKLTGISRSNVYNGLALLVEHGAAYVQEGASTRYTPVALEEFCENRLRHLKEAEAFLLKHSPKEVKASEGYLTIEGYTHICDKIRNMLLGAEQRIYFSAKAGFLQLWQKELESILEREIKVVLISTETPPMLRGGGKLWKRVIFYQADAGTDGEDTWEDRDRQIRLIADSTYALTGEVTESGTDTCLYSAQRNFVNVFKEAMKNEIELIRLKKEEQTL